VRKSANRNGTLIFVKSSVGSFGGLWEIPVLAAPMAGGVSTTSLVVAVGEAGGFGFVPAGYKSAVDFENDLRAVRARSSRPFGVNLFVPGEPNRNPRSVAEYARELAPEAARLAVELGTPTWDDDEWEAKLGVVIDTAPAVCSFAFGCPDRRHVDALRRRGTAVLVTVTSVGEADAALSAGVDALCAQGTEAGAHRASFDDTAVDEHLSTLDLVAAITARSRVPVVAAGGIARPDDVRVALKAGAAAVQVGTAFLRADESGASAMHKAALVDPNFATTVHTRSFTGRRARALRNRFTIEHDSAPSAYPEIHHLARPLRAAAVQRSDPNATNLWAGTGHRHAGTGPAAAIAHWLAS
jgi:nitronate monooxygenase